MNIYSKKQVWKLALLISAVLIGVASLLYTNNLVEKLSKEEEKKVKLVAGAMEKLASADIQNTDVSFLFNILQTNETVPVILVGENDSIQSFRNLDSLKAEKDVQYLYDELAEMKIFHEPIIINLPGGAVQKIYYKNSILIDMLKFYPYIQLGVIAIFIVVAYLAFSYSRNAEQNQVWVGLAKETAHQLGTPLSSLVGWAEYLKSIGIDDSIYQELKKDVSRLETITDRFSKIGSQPKLLPTPILPTIDKTVNYLKTRFSDKVEMTIHPFIGEGQEVDLNVPLFEWVIENLCKNAVDAMDGDGSIDLYIKENAKGIKIEVTDTGKGIMKSQFKKVFKPGFTTKKRGWGLGLSLVKRIIEQYHHGKIFVSNSELNVGTTFTIYLSRSEKQELA